MSERWTTLLAVDFDKWACRTYSANFPGVEVRCASVADELERLPDADVVLGGPPCQPHSNAGKRMASKDERDCGPDYVAAVAKRKPRMFLMENVEGLLSSEGGRYAQRLFAAFGEAGYVVDVKLLDAVSFGVPQFRSRCWWWGIRADLYAAGLRHKWPSPTHQWPWPEGESMFGGDLLPAVTVGQALGLNGIIQRPRQTGAREFVSTGEPMQTISGTRGDENRIHEYRWSDAMLQKHPPASPASPAPTVQAKWFKGGAEGLVEVSGAEHGVALADQPCPTIKAGGNRDGAGKQGGGCPPLLAASPLCRRLSALECLRLQSGPDDFRWPEGISKTAQYRIIGNGWASGMSAAMSRALADADPESHTVIDLFCGGGLGAVGWHGRYWKWEPQPTPTPRPLPGEERVA